MRVLISGTPGAGKTTLAKEISSRLSIKHIDITYFIKENKLYDSYNEEFDTVVFSEKKVAKALKNEINGLKSFIIDTHSPYVAKKIDFDHILIIKCEIGELRDRLERRNYSEKKINENIECEIFHIVEEELQEIFEQDLIKINSSKKPDPEMGLDYSHAIEWLIQEYEKIKL